MSRKTIRNRGRGAGTKTHDGFTNFQARVGLGADNLASQANYSFNYVTRNRQQLEAMYRGSWLIGQAVDAPAEDMTRAGIDIQAQLPPAQIELLQSALMEKVWDGVANTIRWSRLFGGAIGVFLIENQSMAEPLRTDSIKKGQFKGMLVLDRWMVQVDVNDLVTDYGPHLGKPKFYDVVADAPGLPREKIHYSRVVRFEGLDLPYFQKLGEMLWGESVVERIYDRLVAFDSTTLGAAQLVYRAHLRTLKVKSLRETVAMGGPALNGLLKQMDMMRSMQSNESITLLDAEDEFSSETYTFAGLSDVLMQMGEQISGAVEVPLVRLFGQSPAGFSTGETDLTNYYESIRRKQDTRLRQPMGVILDLLCRSELGIDPPADMTFTFRSLKVPNDKEKADVASGVTTAVQSAWESGLVTQDVALKELRQSSRQTGIWTNITDEDITAAKGAPPPNAEQAMGSEEEGAGDAGQPVGIQEAQRHLGSIKDEAMPDDGEAPRSMTKLDYQGLPLVIETGKGEVRKARDGSWQAKMAADYGYVEGTGSAEGPDEGMDVFVGPLRHSQRVYVIDQANLSTGEFDEHKCMLGYFNQSSATRDYCASYHDGKGQDRIMGVKVMTLKQFKDWLKSDDWAKPLTIKTSE